jgi:hypothetical protein
MTLLPAPAEPHAHLDTSMSVRGSSYARCARW